MSERTKPVHRIRGLRAGATVLMSAAALGLAACENVWNPFRKETAAVSTPSTDSSMRDQFSRVWDVKELDNGTPYEYDLNEQSLRASKIKTAQGRTAIRLHTELQHPTSWYNKDGTSYVYNVNPAKLREKGVYTLQDEADPRKRIVIGAMNGEFVLDPSDTRPAIVYLDPKTKKEIPIDIISRIALREEMSVSVGLATPDKDGNINDVAIIATSPDKLKKEGYRRFVPERITTLVRSLGF